MATRRPSRIRVPTRWQASEYAPFLYANQVFVRLEEGQVLITFGQAVAPYEVPPLSDETLERVKREGVPVYPVARLAVAPQQLGLMIEHLTTILNVWQKTTQRPLKEKAKKAHA